MEYIQTNNEDFRDFLCRTLKNQTDARSLQLFTVLLEIIVSEIKNRDYKLSVNCSPQEIIITISHHGKAIIDSILRIIDDQVDRIRYRHITKDHHVLKMNKYNNSLLVVI